MAVSETPLNAEAGGADWLRPGARAILCNLGKFPKFNGQVVEIASWNDEKKRWKCLLSNGGDVVVYPANLEPAEMPTQRVEQIKSMLEEGRVYEAWKAMQTKASMPPELKTALDSHVASGTYSEIVEGRLVLADFEEKGRGYKAAKSIKQGDVLLFDTPVGCHKMPTGPADSAPNMFTNKDPYVELSNQIRTHGKEDSFIQNHVMTLPQAPGGEGHSELVKILAANAGEPSRDPGYIALFPAAALFNHSCCPNAFADSTRSECVVRALCDIAIGEEVCVSYIPLAESLTKRQELLESHNFTCTCKRCAEESKCDPGLRVPCGCGNFNFTHMKSGKMFQTCEKCFTVFDRDESLHNLAKIKEANEKHYREMSAGGDAKEQVKRLTALEKLTMVGYINGVPPLHKESTFLINNLANLHYHLATTGKGDDPAKSLETFHRYKKLTLEKFEERHGNWSNQRDHGYFEILEMVLGTKGLTEEPKQCYTQKLVDACNLLYGQPYLPATLSKATK